MAKRTDAEKTQIVNTYLKYRRSGLRATEAAEKIGMRQGSIWFIAKSLGRSINFYPSTKVKRGKRGPYNRNHKRYPKRSKKITRAVELSSINSPTLESPHSQAAKNIVGSTNGSGNVMVCVGKPRLVSEFLGYVP